MSILESEKNRQEYLKQISEQIELYKKSKNNGERNLYMAQMFLIMKQLCNNDAVFIDEVIKKAKALEEDKDVGQKSKEKSD